MKRITLIGLVVVLAFLPLMVLSCDSDEDNNSGDNKAIENTIKGYVFSYNNSDFDECITYFTGYSNEENIKSELESYRSTLGEIGFIEVSDISITDQTAMATVVFIIGGEEDTFQMQLEKVDGEWKLLWEQDGSNGSGKLDAEITALPTSGNAPLEVQFIDQSTGEITGWEWDFGDGNISIEQNPTHTYESEGIYTVSLTVTGPDGSNPETKADYIIVSSSVPEPGGELEWHKTFGGSEDDTGMSVQQTSDSGYIIAGKTASYEASVWDVLLIKIDAEGNEKWHQIIGGSGTDIGYSVQQTSDDGYIITGHTNSYGAGDFDMWLIKTDADGNELWNKTFGGPDSDIGHCVQQTSDGGYIITGSTSSYGAGNYDVWLIKTDINGDEIWNKTFGGSEDDVGMSVQQTSDGGYIVTGSTNPVGYAGDDVLLIKTNADGDEIWNTTFGGLDFDDCGNSVQQTTDGGYIVIGDKTYVNAIPDSDIWLIKTDADGNELWNKTFGGPDGDNGRYVQQTSNGGYIIATQTASFGSGGDDVWLIKTDADGNKLWNTTFGGPDEDYVNSVQQTSDGGYIVIGATKSYGVGGYDVWLIKVEGE